MTLDRRFTRKCLKYNIHLHDNDGAEEGTLLGSVEMEGLLEGIELGLVDRDGLSLGVEDGSAIID